MQKILSLLPLLLLASNLRAIENHLGVMENQQGVQNSAWGLQAVLTQNVQSSYEGSSVALSADGNILAAGAPRFNSSGGTQIYTRTGSSWAPEATLSQLDSNSFEGVSVALSADGNTLAAGADSFNNGQGATQIYVRPFGTSWTYQEILSQGLASSYEGISVALSADGNTLAAGAWKYNNGQGCTLIYVRSGNAWKHQASLSQFQSNSVEGAGVALSADGNTLAAGALGFDGRAGATQIYIRSGTIWTFQTTVSQLLADSFEGFSVALSADGNTLAVGAPASNGYAGATQIYMRSGTTWAHQAALSRNVASSYEGNSVSLSADGNTMAVGASNYNNGEGATQIYVRSGYLWNYKSTLSQHANWAEGMSVHISANATTLAAGTSFDPGATFIYEN